MKKLTPMRAIREKCLDCCCWQAKEVRLCTATQCPLYPYRMGKRPKNDEFDELIEEDISIEKTQATPQFFAEKGETECFQ